MHGNGLLSLAILVMGMYHQTHSVQQMKYDIMILGMIIVVGIATVVFGATKIAKTSLIYTKHTSSYYDVYLYKCVLYKICKLH